MSNENKDSSVGGVGGCGLEETDTDLDTLLDVSLNEFGKHVPPPPERDSSPVPKPPPDRMGRTLSRVDDSEDPSMSELEKVFGEEFAAQAEVEMNEALKLLSTENPELLKEFETLASSLGLKDEPSQTTPPVLPPRTKGSLDAILEETVRNIHKGGGASIGDMPSKLAEMMNNLQMDQPSEGGGGGEGDEIMSAMEGMMNTLLSKDILYPSLLEFCNQYPEWLRTHSDSLSIEDKGRYTKQLDIMTTICREFEREEEEKGRQERILQLMQQLQECGQPPDDLGGGPIPNPLLSPSTIPTPYEQCSLM